MSAEVSVDDVEHLESAPTAVSIGANRNLNDRMSATLLAASRKTTRSPARQQYSPGVVVDPLAEEESLLTDWVEEDIGETSSF